MLQPQQLEELATHYAAAIDDLRDFLGKAGVAPASVSTLQVLTARLRQDRTFHRDLTSHLWVLMEEGVQQSSTLLGVLAVAAAGPKLAAQAETEDAHALLRFVMEARRSLGIPSENEARIAPVPTVSALPQIPIAVEAAVSSTGPQAHASVSRRWPRTALLLAACVLLAGGGLWCLRRLATPSRTAPAPIVTTGSSAAPVTTNPLATAPGPAAPESVRMERRGTELPRKSMLRGTSPPHTLAAAVSSPPASSAARQSSAGTMPQRTTAPVASAAPVVRQPGSGAPVPSAVLSRRLGSPTVPAYASTEDEAVTRRHPRLLRRQQQQQDLRDSSEDPLLAETSPSDARFSSQQGSGSRSAGTAPVGVVRPASLGTMGANALYTPVPPYPAEASAARVQGEVRIQARIDPGGNVASARVISGPPLLRDAALNAVQHWRYRPYMASGKATAASTTAVVDFELP